MQITESDRAVYDVLLKLVEVWFRSHPPVGPADYSTAQNEFLWLAERAYFDAR